MGNIFSAAKLKKKFGVLEITDFFWWGGVK